MVTSGGLENTDKIDASLQHLFAMLKSGFDNFLLSARYFTEVPSTVAIDINSLTFTVWPSVPASTSTLIVRIIDVATTTSTLTDTLSTKWVPHCEKDH